MLALAAQVALPAAVLADGAGGASPTTAGGGGAATAPGRLSVSASGLTVTTRSVALLSQRLAFTGHVDRRRAGDIVVIERRDPKDGWLQTAHGSVARSGAFSAVWITNHIGRFPIRAYVRHPGQTARAAAAAAATPTLQVTIYRPSIATIYGPGFYGSRTACGQTLTHATIGVAHRWLPCGTKVAVYYHGRSLVVPVIDRGPYANHADWDLTTAAAKALHVDGTVTLGALALRGGR